MPLGPSGLASALSVGFGGDDLEWIARRLGYGLGHDIRSPCAGSDVVGRPIQLDPDGGCDGRAHSDIGGDGLSGRVPLGFGAGPMVCSRFGHGHGQWGDSPCRWMVGVGDIGFTFACVDAPRWMPAGFGGRRGDSGTSGHSVGFA